MFGTSIKLISIVILFFASIRTGWSQKEYYIIQKNNFNEKIDQKQKSLDFLDGKQDSIIRFKDPILTQKATAAFIHSIDSLQYLLSHTDTNRSVNNEYLYQILLTTNRVNGGNIQLAEYYYNLYRNIIGILNHSQDGKLSDFLSKDMVSSINNIHYYKKNNQAKSFLMKAAQFYPNEVLKELKEYSDQPYAMDIVNQVAHISPSAIKKYLNSSNIVNNYISLSKDSVVNLIVNLNRYYGNESKVYFFIDFIYHHVASPEILDSISKDSKTYLSTLIRANELEDPLGKYDLERELAIRALEEVRRVNDLHELTDTSIRFASVRDMDASDLYTLIVYSPEEIFTSTFNGLYERLLKKVQAEGMNGYFLLDKLKFNRFRTFIKLCAGYNTLEDFLAHMEKDQAISLLKMFVSELHADDGDISEAVNVADTFGSLNNKEYLDIFKTYLIDEFRSPVKNEDTKALYGLLLKLLYERMGTSPDSLLATQLAPYQIPTVETVSLANDNTPQASTVQVHFFFDDEDGLTSFSTFVAAFRNAGYQIQDSPYYIILRGKDKYATTIYANKPKFEREGQAELEKLMQENIIKPDILVHRGHSYYAMNTITQIPPYTKVVFLGSCGGYHNISEVIKRAPQAQIIASKQIGTYVVNNALLVEMSKMIKDKDQIVWNSLWKSLDQKLKGTGKGYDRFLDYIAPNKNMGALFIQAYNRITSDN